LNLKLLKILQILQFLPSPISLHHRKFVGITQVDAAEAIVDFRDTMIILTSEGEDTSSLAFVGFACTGKGYKAEDGTGQTI
jgi:hypothetical protein